MRDVRLMKILHVAADPHLPYKELYVLVDLSDETYRRLAVVWQYHLILASRQYLLHDTSEPTPSLLMIPGTLEKNNQESD